MTKRFFLLPDLLITIPAFLIVCLSVLVLYSSDPGLALLQGLFAVVGFIIYIFISLLDLEYFESIALTLYSNSYGPMPPDYPDCNYKSWEPCNLIGGTI